MTAVQNQMVMAEQYEQLWKALMPNVLSPDRQQFLLWVGTYTEELVSRGINRTGSKARKLRGTENAMSANDAERYAASVMKNELLGIRRHEPGVMQKGAQ
jgi:hypothetical protein